MMALAVLVMCLVLVPASGGTWRAVGAARLPFEVPALILFMLQGMLRGRLPWMTAMAGSWVAFAWGCVCMLLLFTVLREWRQPGVSLVGLGIASNVMVVLLNEGMPYLHPSGRALAFVGPFYRTVTSGTHLAVLGDVLPDPTGRFLVSLGDLLLCLGAVTFVVASSVRSVVARDRVEHNRSRG